MNTLNALDLSSSPDTNYNQGTIYSSSPVTDSMEALGTIAAITQLIQLSSQLSRVLADLYQGEYFTLRKTYGRNVALVLSVVYRSTASEYARIEQVVLRGDDKEALLFRDSVAAESNMTAVAVSVQTCLPRKMTPISL